MAKIDYDTLRKNAENRVKARQEFRQHLASYIMVNLFLWAIWWFTSSGHGGFPWPIFPTFGWGIGIVFHALDVYQKSGMSEVRRELEIEREIQRELEYRGLASDSLGEKPKRAVRLSDDGELIDAEDSIEDDNRGNASIRRSS